MTEFSVERDGLRLQAKKFGGGAEKARTIFRDLQDRLAAEGACWGKDDTGRSFEKTYLPPLQTAENSFPTLAGKLDDAQAAIETMAKNYGDAETASGG